MIDIKKFLKYNRLTIAIIILAILLFIVPITYSRFQSTRTPNTEIETAFYIIDSNYETKSVHLDDLVPSDTPYTYNFTVANNNGTDRAETDIEYTIEITSTTNLPLTYALYLNQEYTDEDSTNIIINDTTQPDEYGTYFKKMVTESKKFSHLKDESNSYQMTVVFPKEYEYFEYQGIIEGIIITVKSKQVIEENN
ncbi:MAG: hypothetical protein SO067_06850 [Bacilli bacterium]|jgi:hypothetical protein|nr:hypothetical protein [Clostridium sp.]MDY3798813.1 hypothetical protein [Bacilli bacterium]